jgi:CheY-like chemotaxis protein
MHRPGNVVLLVDDEPDIRDSLKVLIESRGYTVATAIDGRQAFDLMCDAQPPNLVVLDLLMPGMTGWEFLAKVKKIDRLSQIPVVVVSGLDGELMPSGDEIAGRMQKPIDVNELYGVLDRYLGTAPRPTGQAPHIKTSPAPRSQHPEIQTTCPACGRQKCDDRANIDLPLVI